MIVVIVSAIAVSHIVAYGNKMSEGFDEGLEEEEEPVEEEEQPVEEEKKESYKDLTIQQLKAIVISRGITTSVSKLKKNELIQLLENN